MTLHRLSFEKPIYALEDTLAELEARGTSDGGEAIRRIRRELVALKRIVSGTQAMTVYKPLTKLASHAAEVAVAMGRGEPVNAKDKMNNGKADIPSVLDDGIVVTKDNIKETVIADGWHSAEEIF